MHGRMMKLATQIVAMTIAFAAALFVPAGAIRWPAALFTISFSMFYLTFRENTYLSPGVRGQWERGHTVISTGPYAHVRHPMYQAFVLYAVGTALLLGSWPGVVSSFLLSIAVGYRAVREERVLREERDGYEAYMQRVKWRFVPRVW
jgi:protein-S-isoprenylcysteine O-methyltransferase Ste14